MQELDANCDMDNVFVEEEENDDEDDLYNTNEEEKSVNEENSVIHTEMTYDDE